MNPRRGCYNKPTVKVEVPKEIKKRRRLQRLSSMKLVSTKTEPNSSEEGANKVAGKGLASEVAVEDSAAQVDWMIYMMG